jgi:hypothetical protein
LVPCVHRSVSESVMSHASNALRTRKARAIT